MKISLSRPLVLASQSPRRRQLLAEAGFDFTVDVRPTDELFPADMPAVEIPAFLACHKAEQFTTDLDEQLILCADTIVVINEKVLNKPENEQEAFEMLQLLSGATHEVITGICLLSKEQIITKTDIAKVMFRELTTNEIEIYIESQKPFDKAGAYGIQEWIGMIGIERIEGSYYTIMGLPTHLVYHLLTPYFSR